MPITPFHFGVGLAAKAASPKNVSFLAFVASQVAIDCESAYFLLTQGYPVHRTLHTFAVGVPFGILVGAGVSITWNWWRGSGRRPSSPSGAETGLWPGIVGGGVGGLTHPFLDGLMHPDIKPFWPFSEANPFLDAMSLGALHALCVAVGIAAGLVLAKQRVPKT